MLKYRVMEEILQLEELEERVTSAQKKGGGRLFFGVLLSAFALFFGLIVLGMMVWPVVYGAFQHSEPYFPLLPLSADRAEAFLNTPEIQAKQLFPSLSQADKVTNSDQIFIPSIEAQVPIVMSASLDDTDVINTLDLGAALYPNGILPGRLGNAFIAAHSTGEPWKGKYRFAFLRINELRTGNVIHVDFAGTRYTYTVTEKEIIKPTKDFRVISDRPVPTMTLMACWPLWSTEKRMLIHAELTNMTQLTAPAAV